VVKVYELVVGVVRSGRMVCSLVEGDTSDRNYLEEDLGMEVRIDDNGSCRRLVAVRADMVYPWVPC
jgi:hypothetical protein